MKKIVSLILALLIFSSNIFFIASCGKEEVKETTPPPCAKHTDGDQNGKCDVCQKVLTPDLPKEDEEIRVPTYKDYLRGTENFSELIYTRPDIDAALLLIDELCLLISENELSYEEQLSRLSEIDSYYIDIRSMSALATIYNYKNTKDEFWSAEYLYLTSGYPRFSQGIEKLFVSAANSPHIDSFEKDYFGEGLEEYIDGGIYTDAAVELMAREAELEAEYSSLSADSGSSGANLLVELIKLRRLIADELGYESYEDFAYETLYHDYEPEKMTDFIKNVTEYVIPVYVSLSTNLFYPYVKSYSKTVSDYKTMKGELINSLYDVYLEADENLGEIYSYMLQHALYDIENRGDCRFDASFTTYIEGNASPFLYITLDNSVHDFTTLAHEFGHFADGYINDNGDASLDLKELSSQGLELLTIKKLSKKLDEGAYKYLLYTKLDDLLSTIIFQSFYASFEAQAYALKYEDITPDKLNAIVAKTAKNFGISNGFDSLHYVLIPHLFLYPFYVQSYATSATAALEIYTIEAKNEGLGFELYSTLLNRSGLSEESFTEILEKNGLASPFDSSALKEILNELHYLTLGAYYYKPHGSNAA